MTKPNNDFARPAPNKQPRQPRTYQLSPAIVERIGAMADSLNVWPSTLVNILLERGLEEVDEGRWQLGAEPAAYRAVWKR